MQSELDDEEVLEIGREYYVFHKTVKKIGVYGKVKEHGAEIILDGILSDDEVRKISKYICELLEE